MFLCVLILSQKNIGLPHIAVKASQGIDISLWFGIRPLGKSLKEMFKQKPGGYIYRD